MSTIASAPDTGISKVESFETSAKETSHVEFDTLRGLAMIAVVSHHVSLRMVDALTGLTLSLPNVYLWLSLISDAIAPLRIPLFTILSGYIYAKKPVTREAIQRFMSGKIRRLLLPLMFVSIVKYLYQIHLRGITPSYTFLGVTHQVDLHDVWQLWFFHFGHLWFLQALFLIFCGVVILELLGLLKSFKMWLLWMIVLTVAPYIIHGSSFLSLYKAIPLTVFFIGGLGLYRFRDIIANTPHITPMAWALFIVLLTLNIAPRILKQLDIDFNLQNTRIIYVLAGVCGSYCLMQLRLKIHWLAWIGGFSYTIYLYHGLGLTTHQLFDDMLQWGEAGGTIWWTLTLASGLLLPIAIHKLFINIPVLRAPTLGKSFSVK